MEVIQEEMVWRPEVVIVSSSLVPGLSLAVRICLHRVPPFLHKHLPQ